MGGDIPEFLRAGPPVPATRKTLSSALAELRSAVRWDEWYLSKVPFVWIACAWAAAGSAQDDSAVLATCAAMILFTCLCGAFGHVANDHADRACDGLAGRTSLIAQARPATIWALLALLSAGAIGIVGLLGAGWETMALAILTLCFAAGYSLPPIRLKMRGALGLWSAAAAQRTLPVLVAFSAFDRLDSEAIAFAAVAQLNGLRWMLVHQLADARNDAAAGVATYVVRSGEKRARTLLRRIVFPLEILSVAVALLLEWSLSRQLGLVLLAYAVASAIWIRACAPFDRPYALEGSSRQPLGGLYQAVWPIAAGLALAISRPALWPFAIAFLVWEWRFLRVQLGTTYRLLRRNRSGS